MDRDTFWQDVMGMSGTHRQESDTNKGRLLLDDPPLIMSLVVGTILLAVHLIILIPGKKGHLLPATYIMPRLENHPMCGLTTGGQVSWRQHNTCSITFENHGSYSLKNNNISGGMLLWLFSNSIQHHHHRVSVSCGDRPILPSGLLLIRSSGTKLLHSFSSRWCPWQGYV